MSEEEIKRPFPFIFMMFVVAGDASILGILIAYGALGEWVVFVWIVWVVLWGLFRGALVR